MCPVQASPTLDCRIRPSIPTNLCCRKRKILGQANLFLAASTRGSQCGGCRCSPERFRSLCRQRSRSVEGRRSGCWWTALNRKLLQEPAELADNGSSSLCPPACRNELT